MSNIIRTYFVFPNMHADGFKNLLDEPLGYLHSSKIRINNAETLTQNYFDEIVTVLETAEDKWDYADCQVTGCNINALFPQNTFNPLLDLGLTFPTVDGAKRGKAVGTVTTSNYGAGILNLGAAQKSAWYIPEVGAAAQEIDGPIFIDIDYDVDYSALFQVRFSSPLSEGAEYVDNYEIDWVASTGVATFKKFRKGFEGFQNIIEFGFLSGERTAPNLVLPDPIPPDDCIYDIRCLGHAVPVVIPVVEDPAAPSKCCEPMLVFASTSTTDSKFNDIRSIEYYRNLESDSVSFILYDVDADSNIPLNDNTLGILYGFGDLEEPNLSGFILEWNKVINIHGEGNYRLDKNIETAGISVLVKGIIFSLKEFSTILADRTVRITSIQNGSLIHKGISFENVNWVSQLRISGYFGQREPSTEEESIIYKDFTDRQMRMIQSNEYILQTYSVKDCVFKELHDFLLFGNEIFIDDYNLDNHAQYLNFPVKYKNNGGTEYLGDKNIWMKLIFEDRRKDKIKSNFGSVELAGSQFLQSGAGIPPAPEPCEETKQIKFRFADDELALYPIEITNAEAGTYISLTFDAGSTSGTINVNGIDESFPISLIATDIVIAKRGTLSVNGFVQINT